MHLVPQIPLAHAISPGTENPGLLTKSMEQIRTDLFDAKYRKEMAS